MRSFVKMVPPVAAVLCTSVTAAEAVTEIWRFDFTSPRGGGAFEVDGGNFVIPAVGQPASFNVLAADINVDAGGPFGPVHYTLSNVVVSGCTSGGECILSVSIPNYAVAGFGTYDVTLQLNFEKIWVPWLTSGQQAIQMFLDTNPHVPSWSWNEVGTGQRTVINPVLAWKPAPGTSDWNTANNWATYAVPTAADTPQFGASTITTIEGKPIRRLVASFSTAARRPTRSILREAEADRLR